MATFDLSGDFANVTDGLETVVLVRRGGEETVVAGALRRIATVAEGAVGTRTGVYRRVPSGGRQIAAEAAWHLPSAAIDEPPRVGDVIRDAEAGRWTILEVHRTTLGDRWRCATRNVAVAFGLDDAIGVLRAVYVKGACGAAEPVWRAWRTGVRARIQPVETQMVADASARGAVAKYRIFVEEDLYLDHTCRIRGPDGTLYAITAISGAERIGELQVIDAEATQ